MFSIRFSCRAACANIVVDQLFQGGYRRRPIELYILTASWSDVGQRVAKAFDVAKHYLPVNTCTADCTYPPYHTLCHFARIQNTTHIHAIQRSSVPLFQYNCQLFATTNSEIFRESTQINNRCCPIVLASILRKDPAAKHTPTQLRERERYPENVTPKCLHGQKYTNNLCNFIELSQTSQCTHISIHTDMAISKIHFLHHRRRSSLSSFGTRALVCAGTSDIFGLCSGSACKPNELG
uniref:(northern house mosquito) hypothetical protein n=1 Tax=Culex pipiens TaxID=7175 RepID=A0A8D8G9E3_CULPI